MILFKDLGEEEVQKVVYKFKKQDLISFWEVKSVIHITRNGDNFILFLLVEL